MDRIEEVKKILGHFRQLEYIDRTSYQAGINADSNLTEAAKEICQLFEARIEALIEDTLRDFSHIQREAGHPTSYWAGYQYARGLMIAAFKATHTSEKEHQEGEAVKRNTAADPEAGME